MDIETRNASPGYPLPTFHARRDNATAAWPDAWLINAVRREPPDEAALNILVARYLKQLFGRCQMLTLDRDAARDLAQDSWLRVLQARGTLKPGGNFHAYIMTIATNLWHDRHRNARRAGAMSDDRLESLDATDAYDDQPLALMDVVTQPDGLPPDDRLLLKLDVDNALERLSPHLRDALVSRFLVGESAAEIARRCDRTQQTISSWIREAAREMRVHLACSGIIGAVLLSMEVEPFEQACYRNCTFTVSAPVAYPA
jgi:RNA polymerase sigma factor (sigma-70 family)